MGEIFDTVVPLSQMRALLAHVRSISHGQFPNFTRIEAQHSIFKRPV